MVAPELISFSSYFLDTIVTQNPKSDPFGRVSVGRNPRKFSKIILAPRGNPHRTSLLTFLIGEWEFMAR